MVKCLQVCISCTSLNNSVGQSFRSGVTRVSEKSIWEVLSSSGQVVPDKSGQFAAYQWVVHENLVPGGYYWIFRYLLVDIWEKLSHFYFNMSFFSGYSKAEYFFHRINSYLCVFVNCSLRPSFIFLLQCLYFSYWLIRTLFIVKILALCGDQYIFMTVMKCFNNGFFVEV